jgi:hypothetical protein
MLLVYADGRNSACGDRTAIRNYASAMISQIIFFCTARQSQAKSGCKSAIRTSGERHLLYLAMKTVWARQNA